MKKNYAFMMALLAATTIQAQQIVDFESHSLNTESYDNGSSGGGDFSFIDISLTNYYDTAWSSWNGFSISNITDNVTAGWGNQYSAYTGEGSNNSSNYGIFYPWGQISGNPGAFQLAIDSFKITNSTYTAISMRDGDAFAKQFGSPLDASGVADGTNGEDYLKVWIICEDESGGLKDSIEFFLADYRFADSTQDYIIDSWVNVDVSNLGFQVHHINFRFESSDNAAWGMNTPSYFAVDDIAYEWFIGIDEIEIPTVSVYPNPATDEVIVKGGEGIVTLTAVNGEVIRSIRHEDFSRIDISTLESGIYFVTLENNAVFVTTKLIVQ